jgi:hypothetical protein
MPHTRRVAVRLAYLLVGEKSLRRTSHKKPSFEHSGASRTSAGRVPSPTI